MLKSIEKIRTKRWLKNQIKDFVAGLKAIENMAPYDYTLKKRYLGDASQGPMYLQRILPHCYTGREEDGELKEIWFQYPGIRFLTEVANEPNRTQRK